MTPLEKITQLESNRANYKGDPYGDGYFAIINEIDDLLEAHPELAKSQQAIKPEITMNSGVMTLS